MGCENSKPKNLNNKFNSVENPTNLKTPSKKMSGQKVVVGMFPFTAIQSEDLSFNLGDRMKIIKYTEDKLWIYASHLKTNQMGYIPANYVQVESKSNPSIDGYLDIGRTEAEIQMLFSEETRVGTFIVRPATGGGYALTVMSHGRVIKHYKIYVNVSRGGLECYISQNRLFSSLGHLLEYYQKHSELTCLLANPLKGVAPSVASRKLVIDYVELSITGELGQGNFGKVYKARWNNAEVALKTLKGETKKEFLDEARIMHSLDHKNLVKLLGVSVNGEQSVLCMEFMHRGHLLGVIKADRGKSINLEMLAKMAVQVASGMVYLSDQGLIHRDLRAENVLVNKAFVCKIADFGLAKRSETFQASHDTKFPVKWTAIEAATQGRFSIKSDVWSFGILVWELVTFGEVPYKGMTGQEVLRNLKTGYRMKIPSSVPHPVPDKWYEQMLMCWDEDPQNRPHFHSLVDFFENSGSGCPDYVD